MRRVGGDGFLYLMIAVYAALAVFAFWRRLRRPVEFRAKGADALKVSPMTTPSGAAALGE